MTYTLSILAVLLLIISVFLGKEMLKKFGFMRSFVQNSDQLVTWRYEGGRKPGMYNVVLRGQSPFSALVGIDFQIKLLGHNGFDHYAFLQSDQNNTAVISTYLGKGACNFHFLTNTNLEANPITITSGEADQTLTPNAVSKPHWYQRIGFYS